MNRICLCLVAAALTFILSACGEKSERSVSTPSGAPTTAGTGRGEILGPPVPSDIAAARIGDIIANPHAYKDRRVAVEGFTGSVGCIDCGGVLLVEGVHRLLVEPADPSKFKIPLRRGARLMAWGRVHVENGHEELEEKEEDHEDPPEYSSGPEKTAAAVYVEIKAEGVEFR